MDDFDQVLMLLRTIATAVTQPILSTSMSSQTQSSQFDVIFSQKRVLRSKLRKLLRDMDPIQRSHEDNAIQSIILEARWFKSSKRLCAYVSCDALREVSTSNLLSEILQNPSQETKKKLYVPRVENTDSYMRMLNISSIGDLTSNFMGILEPTPTDGDGNGREDVMEMNDPVDAIILPGLAFDRSGRRLGRGGGYYDSFLNKYRDYAKVKRWKPPFLVALSYSSQIMDDNVIPIATSDINLDAIVTSNGLIPITPIAMETYRD